MFKLTLAATARMGRFASQRSSVADRPQAGGYREIGLTRGGQLKESVELLGGVDAHDELLQFLALILADDIAAERGEFYRDFILGHWIARIAFGNIDAGGVRLAVIGRDGHAAWLELRETALRTLRSRPLSPCP